MSKSISFVIPMFNAEKFIGKCIDSIIAQNLGDSNYEIIVVDDGSRDKSKEIVQNHPCVKYFYKENGGQSTARNLGIEKATGDYICFVDADDYMIDNSIFCVVNMAEQNNLDMACYELGRPDEFKDTKNDFIESRIFSGGEYIAEYEFNNGPWWYLIRREFIEKNNLRFVEGRYGEDGMFTMLALLKAQRIQHCNQFCYCYACVSGKSSGRFI